MDHVSTETQLLTFTGNKVSLVTEHFVEHALQSDDSIGVSVVTISSWTNISGEEFT